MFAHLQSGRTKLAIIGLALAATGCHRIVASWNSPRPDDPPLEIADSVRSLLLVAGRAVVDSALVTVADTAPACVSFTSGSSYYRLEPADLSRLAEPRRRYIARTKCPRTYTSMIATVDSLGRPVNLAPHGYVDPHYLLFQLPGRWTNDRFDITVNVVQGTRTDSYLCFTRLSARGPVAACRYIRTALSQALAGAAIARR